MLYTLLKPLLFAVDAELAHEISLELLNEFSALLPQTRIENPRRVMGIDFPNPVGLAAGLDKNGDYKQHRIVDPTRYSKHRPGCKRAVMSTS